MFPLQHLGSGNLGSIQLLMERASLDTREVREAPLLVAEVGVWPARARVVLQVLKVAGTVNLHRFQQMASFSVAAVEETAPVQQTVDCQFMVVLEEEVHRPELVELPCLQERVVMITFRRP
jgi:hypothetical protein